MKTLITTLNAKFIHTALSVRLLYVACMDKQDVSYKEYTIKDHLDHICEDILTQGYDIVAFSCYIWNIDYIKPLCEKLKALKEDIIIILGGPEVTYEPEHFINHFKIDYVMSGEGEETFPKLLDQIQQGQTIDVCGVSYKDHISKDVAMCDLSYVEKLPSPYDLPQDLADKNKKILYFETSRGCPFQCQYCLSSLEKGLRFFSKEYLERQLDIVIHSGAKVVKLLDRSFNANVDHALFILEYLFTHYVEGQQFQFEINADVLQQPILDYINNYAPKGLIRLEIGIQSTYEPTNKAVKRIQNFKRLSEVVLALMEGGKCDLHLDLIAGLPFENYERFKQSFDDVFAFKAKELQLGFLKLLRGTSLRINADDFGYIYEQNAPYEMIENHWINQEDIKKIHLAEDMLEKYWNSQKFESSMPLIMKKEKSAFDFFYNLGCYYENNNYKKIGYQTDELFKCINAYTNRQYEKELVIDYLKQFKTRPKKWFESTLTQTQRHELIEKISSKYHINKDRLYRYAIVEKYNDDIIVAVYQDMICDLNLFQV